MEQLEQELETLPESLRPKLQEALQALRSLEEEQEKPTENAEPSTCRRDRGVEKKK